MAAMKPPLDRILVAPATVCLLAFYLVTRTGAAQWGWDETLSGGDLTNPGNWLRLDGPPPPMHGVPQAGDDIVAFNTTSGQVTIRCSGNTVGNAILDCGLDLGGGGL